MPSARLVTKLMFCLQEDKITDWNQLAQRAFQDFFGLGKALSAPEKQEVEKAANAEPWVHMVSAFIL